MLVLGVDGGGTTTMAVVVNERKELKGVGVAGPCRYHEIGVEAARDNLIEAIKMASPYPGNLVDRPFEQAVFGMGGLDSEVDREVIEGFVKSTKVASNYLVVNDIVVAFYAATLGSPGIVVESGTGSIMYGSDGKRESGMIGGWGSLIGDEGSAVNIARRALQEAAKIYDGRRDGRTVLIDRAMEYFEVSDLREVISKVSAKSFDLRHFSGFSKVVTQAAEDGDDVARGIIKEAAIELVDGGEATVKKLSLPEDFIVGCAGGVFKSSILYHAFRREMESRFPSVKVEDPVSYPVVGAIVIGLSRKGIKMSKREARELEERIERSLNAQPKTFYSNDR